MYMHYKYPKIKSTDPMLFMRSFPANAVPKRTYIGEPQNYDLQRIAAEMMKFHQHSMHIVKLQEARQIASTEVFCVYDLWMIFFQNFVRKSHRLIQERVKTAGVGVCTAYVDGRVHITFEDFTLLDMDATATFCDCVLPNGQTTRVTTAMPMDLATY